MAKKSAPLTAEALEKHVSKYNLKAFQPPKKGAKGIALPDVCPPYKMIRPILKAVLLIPFISKKIKDAIKAFISFMDAICP